MLSAAGGLALATLVSHISPLVVLSDRVDILGDGFSNDYAIAIRVRRSPKSSFGEAQDYHCAISTSMIRHHPAQ